MRLSALGCAAVFLVWLAGFGRAEVRGLGYGRSQNVCVDLGNDAGEFLEIGLDGYFDDTRVFTRADGRSKVRY